MKDEREFTPLDAISFTPCSPPLPGLDEKVIVREGAPGIVTRLLRFAPGLDTSANGTLAHDFFEEVYILEGEITDLRLNQTFGPGQYASRPPRMPHGPWKAGSSGCLTFEVRYTPVSD